MTRTAGIVAAAALAGAALTGTAGAAEPSFHSSVRELSPTLRAQLTGEFWRPGCPVTLDGLRLLTVRHWGLDGKAHVGQLVVAREYADPLRGVFRQLYDLRFRIRHLSIRTSYGPADERPTRDVSGSFHCRKAVPSPCGTGSGNWSNHAYGRAIDLNPLENPYVGCGRVRDRASDPYLDRSRTRPGMVTAAVVRAFRSIGWGWGGAWTGDTRDYMHFSANGR